MKKKNRNVLFTILFLFLTFLPLFQILFNIIPSNLIIQDNKLRIIPKYYDGQITNLNVHESSIKLEDKLEPYIEDLLISKNKDDIIPLIIYLNYQPGEKIALKLTYEENMKKNDRYYHKLYELTKEEIKESQNKLVTKILKLNGTIKHKFSIINAISVDLPLKYIKSLASHPNVSKISYDYLLKANLQYSVPSITNVPPNSWNYSYNGTNVVVAVCDSGINVSHPNLANNIIDRYNTYTGGSNVPDDTLGHGTYVAGIIANNDSISHGVAPNVSLLIVKVFDSTGTGPSSNLMKGVEWALTKAVKRPDIINFSGGTATTSHDGMSTLTIFVDAITSKYNVLWINAAGNKGLQPGHVIELPADAYNSIAVGELRDSGGRDINRTDDVLMGSSSYGPTLDGRIKPDIVAIGYNVNSCNDETGKFRNDLTGTSFSAPHVCGAAALIYDYLEKNTNIVKSYYPLITKALLLHTADDWSAVGPGTDGPDYYTGYGYVNLANVWNLTQSGLFIETNSLKYDHMAFKLPFFYNLTLYQNEIFNITLVWNRHAEYKDDIIFIWGNGRPNNLNLYLLDSNLKRVNSSTDSKNNIEQISYKVPETGKYYLKIVCKDSHYFRDEPYSLISTHNLSVLNPSGPRLLYYTLSPEYDVDLDFIFFKSFDTFEKVAFYLFAFDEHGIYGGTFNMPLIRTFSDIIPPLDIYLPIPQIFPNVLYYEVILYNLFLEQGLNKFNKIFLDGSIWATFSIFDAHPIAPLSSTYYCIIDYHGFIWNFSISALILLSLLIIVDFIRERRAKKNLLETAETQIKEDIKGI
ncbi:MAG: S8 family serine peptidase [Candidatus Hodarchaeota archaeon]